MNSLQKETFCIPKYVSRTLCVHMGCEAIQPFLRERNWHCWYLLQHWDSVPLSIAEQRMHRRRRFAAARACRQAGLIAGLQRLPLPPPPPLCASGPPRCIPVCTSGHVCPFLAVDFQSLEFLTASQHWGKTVDFSLHSGTWVPFYADSEKFRKTAAVNITVGPEWAVQLTPLCSRVTNACGFSTWNIKDSTI